MALVCQGSCNIPEEKVSKVKDSRAPTVLCSNQMEVLSDPHQGAIAEGLFVQECQKVCENHNWKDPKANPYMSA